MSSSSSTPSSPSRRRFLRWGAGLTTLSVVGWVRTPRAFHLTDGSLKNLRSRSATVLASVFPVMLPPSAPSSPKDLERYVRAVDDYLTGLDPFDILQVNALLLAIDQTPLLFRFQWRRFSRANPGQQAASLRGWQTSMIGLRRLAYRTLKTMCFLAYYQDDRAFKDIGYPGPLFRQFKGLPHSQKRYDGLLAPKGKQPTSPVKKP